MPDVTRIDAGEMLTEQVRLGLRRVMAQTTVGPAVAQSMAVTRWEDMLTGHLVYALVAEVQTQHLDSHTETASETVEFLVPASWWQHFKRDVLARHRLTRWFAQWRPVRQAVETRTVTLSVSWEQFASFPESKIVAHPGLGGPVLNLAKAPPVWRVS